MAKLASENEHLYSKNEQLLCQLTAHSELLTTNQQLMATLAEVKERMEGLSHWLKLRRGWRVWVLRMSN